MKRHKGNRWQGVLLGTFLGVSSLFAQQGQTGYQPTPENLQARQEFSDSKFGIFLHWGIYSMFVNPEKPDVPLNKNDAFQKVQKRHVQEKR